jgi:hypothetical protein
VAGCEGVCDKTEIDSDSAMPRKIDSRTVAFIERSHLPAGAGRQMHIATEIEV